MKINYTFDDKRLQQKSLQKEEKKGYEKTLTENQNPNQKIN